MRTLTLVAVIALMAAVPAFAKLAANRISANGVALQDFDSSDLSVQSVVLADGTVIALN